MASWVNSFASWSRVSSLDNMALIVVVCICGLSDRITKGTFDRVHVGGHLVNAICGLAQSTSGLCVRSQSVLNIMS